MQQFIKGNIEETVEYRRRAKDGRTIWAQTVARLYCGPITGNTMCFIYSYDTNDSKIAQEMISNVVNLDYDYLSLVDLANNDYIMYANTEDPTNPIPPLRSSDYEKSVADYARENLVTEDIDRNIRDMSIDNIRKQLADKDSFISYVSLKEKDGSQSRKKLQYSYMDRDHEMVLLSRMVITDIYEREQEQMRELKDANRAKNDFLSQMSHDLRTPMNAIVGLSNLAKDELDDLSAMKKYIDNINEAGQFLLGLVNDCLDMEKLSAKKMKLNETPYIYPQFVNSVCTIIAPLCRKKNIKLIVDNLPEPYYVLIDHIRFEQIFINLLNNSVKYTPEGGTIELRVMGNEREGDCIHSHLMVKDNGIGMSEAFQTRMFLPFEQESPGGNQQDRGTGLGLPIVKNLVDLMGGKITVKSKQNVGTEFHVFFDMPVLKTDEVEDVRPASAADLQVLSGKRILICEDNQLNLEIARKLLEKKDVQVICAENGKVGVETFSTSEPGYIQAIIMDIRMPVMDGIEATKRIRALKRADAKTIPIVAMTANAFEEDVRATLDAGMNEHLGKPVDPNRLYSVLAELMEKRN